MVKAKLATVLAGLLAVTALIAPAAGATPFQRDVFVRDNVSDVGNEPSAGSIYYSPDIKVCSTPVLCAVSQNPVVGVNNYVFVTLRRKPGGIGFVDGNLHLYRSNLGGGTAWPGGWTYIGTAGSSVPVSGTTVMITWPGWNVPGPAHFCLLARWVSNADPMTFAEGANTQLNAQRNNNIAWRNVDSVRVRPFEPVRVPYTIGNPERGDARQNLIFEQPRPFAGTATIDLGRELTARWKAAGGRATGVKQVGETQFQLVDTKASIEGLVLKGDERIETALTFATDKEAGPAELHVRQVDVQGTDLGGAQYLINEKD
ncbi:hypothetical protein OG205_06205 [Lentzea sp. NBC_00516]|uniref:hypothetical protein n=1 Tax=Lentzea sp. NBC_00516 TaxID=2903582 RepID=UPI002E81092C|nr:hypothetical protein [Lentzea sp. NBC_00516]WUD26585.1 hypothetical protein OG205_06205 [Lentzea sp. NBC_00516]